MAKVPFQYKMGISLFASPKQSQLEALQRVISEVPSIKKVPRAHQIIKSYPLEVCKEYPQRDPACGYLPSIYDQITPSRKTRIFSPRSLPGVHWNLLSLSCKTLKNAYLVLGTFSVLSLIKRSEISVSGLDRLPYLKI